MKGSGQKRSNVIGEGVIPSSTVVEQVKGGSWERENILRKQ